MSEDELCPMGDDCGIHHRVDQARFDEESEFGQMITYVGDCAVVTSDNPELNSPGLMLAIALGGIRDTNIPPMYETSVIHVGNGTLNDVRKLSREGQVQAVRFIQLHDDWGNFKSAHDMVAWAVEGGTLDLSRSAYEGE